MKLEVPRLDRRCRELRVN